MPRITRTISFSLLLSWSLAAVFLPGAASAGPWQLSETKLLTETVAATNGYQQVPKAVGLAEGWCVTWLDWRQGGAILAARIDEGGRVMDPFGIPILKGQHPVPHAVLESSEGCVVVHAGDTAFQIAGTLIPYGEGAVPRRHFQIPNPSRQLAATRDHLLYSQNINPAGARLRLIDSEGRTVAETTMQDRPVNATPVGNGFIMVTGGEPVDGEADLTLWKVSAELELEQIGETFRGGPHLDIASSPSGFLLVWTRSDGDQRRAAIASFTTSGAEVGRFEVELPPTASHMISIDYDGTYAIEWLSYLTTHVVRTDGQRVLESYGLPDIIDHEIARKNGRALHVRSRRASLEYEIATGAQSGEGYPITRHPRHELLLDAADEGDAVALAWIERDDRERKQRLWVARTSKRNPSLETRKLITEVDTEPAWAILEAAVAIEDGITMVVWTTEQGLMQRRLDALGEWIEPVPQLVRASSRGSVAFTADGLVAGDGSFLVFSEYQPGGPRLMGASGPRGGLITSVRELRVQPESEGPHSAALVMTSNRIVVSWLEPGGECNLSACPPPTFEVGLGVYDRAFELVSSPMETRPFSKWPPVLGSAGEAVLLALSDHVQWYESSDGAEFVEFPLEMPQSWRWISARSFIHWTGEEFLVLNHGFDLSTFESTIAGWLVGSRSRVRPAFVPIDDWVSAGIYPARAYAMQHGDDLLIFSSQISPDREEGMVRRLRMHTMKPVVRTRAVSR